MTAPREELADLIEAHGRAPSTATPIAGLTLLRADVEAAVPIQVVYTPKICVIAQGRKRVRVGDRTFDYDARSYLVTSVHLPIAGQVVAASPKRPYLSLSLEIDVDRLSDVMLGMPAPPIEVEVPRGLAISAMDDALLDAFVRLLRLLDRPADRPMLAPLIEREILYRLLVGEEAPMLRQMVLRDSRTRQVTRVVDWLRTHYARPFRMSDLTSIAHMSAPSLHRHFKALTAISPLQYQKQIRLQEARRILIAEGRDAATVGFSVGYGSPSQFSREYSRLFGSPPRKDVDRLLGGGARPLD